MIDLHRFEQDKCSCGMLGKHNIGTHVSVVKKQAIVVGCISIAAHNVLVKAVCAAESLKFKDLVKTESQGILRGGVVTTTS